MTDERTEMFTISISLKHGDNQHKFLSVFTRYVFLCLTISRTRYYIQLQCVFSTAVKLTRLPLITGKRMLIFHVLLLVTMTDSFLSPRFSDGDIINASVRPSR